MFYLKITILIQFIDFNNEMSLDTHTISTKLFIIYPLQPKLVNARPKRVAIFMWVEQHFTQTRYEKIYIIEYI